MCGRRKIERDYSDLADWGDMPFDMVEAIAKQVPAGTVVQFHNNGEPLLYPRLGASLKLFKHCFRSFNTNGKLLIEKTDAIIGNLESLVISVVQDDPEGEEQCETVTNFIKHRGNKKPHLIYRFLGDPRRISCSERWRALPGIVASRILHSPYGSRDYKKPVTIPEIGVCLDFLTHLAIDRYGDASICVRFDPEKLGLIANVEHLSLTEIWERKFELYGELHLSGQRDQVALCSQCEFWGVPIS